MQAGWPPQPIIPALLLAVSAKQHFIQCGFYRNLPGDAVFSAIPRFIRPLFVCLTTRKHTRLVVIPPQDDSASLG